MMSRMLISAAFLALMLMNVALAQDTPPTSTVRTQTTPTLQNADGSWTVIAFPLDKEVTVRLSPTGLVYGAEATAKVTRTREQTMIGLNLAMKLEMLNKRGGDYLGRRISSSQFKTCDGSVMMIDDGKVVPTNEKCPGGIIMQSASGLPETLNLYAIDPIGRATLIGPISVSDNTATRTFRTSLSMFMLILSPEADLMTYASDTAVAFRSSVPQGFAVIPHSGGYGERDGAAVGERLSAATTSGATPAYTAPLLGIPNWRQGTDTEMKINFAGEMTGTRANVSIEPRKDGATTIRMRFHELKEAPGGKRYVLWAVSADNKYHRLGQVVNTGQRNEAEIRTETGLPDFGLFITTEDINDPPPSGTIVGTVIRQ